MDPKMEPVHNFTNELFSLYDYKIPISKAKMGSITKTAMKAIKFYKHVVQNVEKFILKCKPEYKIPGLYVIDSIVRQSRHQFGPEKDVFAPRFARNMEETFAHLFRCSQEDKSKIIRVLNLWQKNNVFAPEVIQPLFDLANPDHPVHQAFMQQQQNQQGDLGNGLNVPRESPSQKEEQGGGETLSALNIQKFQYQQQMMMQQQPEQNMDAIKFNNQLLEYDYGSDGDDGDKTGHQMQSAFAFPFKCLEDPNILKQLQNINQVEMQRYLSEMPGASNSMMEVQQSQVSGITLANINNLRGPPPMIDNSKDQDVELVGDIMPAEIIPVSSRSPTPNRHKRRKSRSRSRDKNRYGRRGRRSRSKSRSRSYSRSPRSKRRTSRDRLKEKEREAEKERRRKGLPDIKKDHLSVCSTTLWVGHLSKLVQQEELSDTFGKYGDIISIDMIPPRGCAYIVMNRRQDAYKAMQALKNHKMQNRAITISWAAGKGVKSKEWKDYFDQTLGVTYIPFNKLTAQTDFEALEEGGMYDEETMPVWVKEKMKQPQIQAAVAAAMPQFFPQSIDTSQPPPNASLLPTMPQFALGPRPIMMPGVPVGLGVPPPNMLVHGMLGLPPGLMGFPMQSAAAAAGAAAMAAANNNQQSNDDHMDIEMEEENHSATKSDATMFFNQPPPMMGGLMMGGNQTNPSSDDDFNNRMGGNRNNRSQSREKDSRQDFRSRGPRERRGGDFNNRNSRWPNDSNGRDRSRSRDGGPQQNNFNQRPPRHQQDIPSLLSQPMPLLDNEGMPSRQRNNDYDFDRRQSGFAGRGGFQQMRGGRGGRGQFNRGGGGMRGNEVDVGLVGVKTNEVFNPSPPGFNSSNNFNDRQGGYHERESGSNQRGRGGGRNWRDSEGDGERRSFPARGGSNYERKSSRWMDNQRSDDWDDEEQPQSQAKSDNQEQSSRNDDNFDDNGGEDYQKPSEDAPPGTEDNDDKQFDESPAVANEPSENSENHQEDTQADVVEDSAGNTTPLCDEAESKD